MNERMHQVRLIRPFKHAGRLYQGQCEMTHHAYERAVRFGLVDGEVQEAKPEETKAPESVSTEQEQVSKNEPEPELEPEAPDVEGDILAAIEQLGEDAPNKKPNVKDVEELIGYDITAEQRNAAWKKHKSAQKREDRNAARQIETR